MQQTATADMAQKAKAMCIAFWDGADKTALRIDLWTKDMMVDEMADFYYQMFIQWQIHIKELPNRRN